MDTPKISVVMPVYNNEKYLRESIESILNQTFSDFEFIIVDDQSTDSSWQIILEYANTDNRIAATHNTEEKGCWSARNFGWNLAKGQYIVIMDSDDIAVPERLQTQFDFMERHPDIDACGTWIQYFDQKESIISFPQNHREIRDALMFYSPIAQPSIFIRAATFEKLHLRYKNNIAEDYELWSRIINHVNFANIPKVLLKYRVHENQTSTAKKNEQNRNANLIRIRNLQNIGIRLSDKEQNMYCDFFSDQFIPKNIDEMLTIINIFEKISVAGKNIGYGEKFQELINFYQKKVTDCGVKNGVTSLKLYFTTFKKLRIFNTFRSNLRYIYHCLKNILVRKNI